MATNQRSPKITQIKFYSINRDIKKSVEAGNWNAERIAEAQHVSAETVRAIKRIKTWPAWEIAKQVHRSQKNATYKAPTQRELKVTQEQGQEALQRGLEGISQSVVTRGEYEGLYNEMRKLRRRVELLENQAHRPSLKDHLRSLREKTLWP